LPFVASWKGQARGQRVFWWEFWKWAAPVYMNPDFWLRKAMILAVVSICGDGLLQNRLFQWNQPFHGCDIIQISLQRKYAKGFIVILQSADSQSVPVRHQNSQNPLSRSCTQPINEPIILPWRLPIFMNWRSWVRIPNSVQRNRSQYWGSRLW